jgi:hypothetical protein
MEHETPDIFRSFRINSEKTPFSLVASVRPSICPSVCLSVRVYQRISHWTDFREIWYWGLLRKSVEKLQICLKSDNNIGQFTWRRKYYYIVDSSTKYFVARQQCTSMAILSGFMLLTGMCKSTTIQMEGMCDFRLPPRFRWNLHSSGIFRSVEWQFCTDVSGQPIGAIFKGQGTSWLLKMRTIDTELPLNAT